MNVKLRVLTAGVLFFTGQAVFAQKKASDTLKPKDAKETKIDEVVVLGYSKVSTKAKDVTASTTVTAEKFENRPTTSFLNSLQGEAPGLTINSTSGQPGSGKIDVIIRGVGSLSAGSEPLYVIDGIISNATQYRNLNDSDIESASILKDAAATSIYGNRAANGVIVINTKRGKYNSPMRFSYNGFTGVSFLPKTDYNMSNTQQALTLEKRAGAGLGATLTDAQINSYPVNTDWRKVFFNAGFTQKHDVAMTVGGQNVNLYSSLGYFDQTGIVSNVSDFKRFTFRNNLNGKSENGKFTYGAQVALSFSKRHQLDEETNANISNNSIQNPLHGANAGLPYLPSGIYQNGQQIYDAIGTNFDGGKNIYSLEDVLRKGSMPNERTETGIIANINLGYKLTDYLTLNHKSGVDYKYQETNFARAPWNYLAIATAMSGANATVNPKPFGGIEDFSKTREFNYNAITSLNFNKTFGDKHTINGGVYLDYLKIIYNGTSQRRTGLNPINWVFGAGTGYVDPVYYANPSGGAPIVYYVPSASASKIKAGALAYFATADYDYDSKYGVSALIRRDGSYRFVSDNKWATFWSVAGRWNIDKENFMQGSIFDMLKLRVSYGEQGNQNIIAVAAGSNPMLVGTNLVRDTYVAGTGYNNIAGALGVGVFANPDVKWERLAQTNIGLDFRLLNRKLEGNIDVYDKTTKDLYNDINLSAVTGTTSIKGNNGKLQNRGIEVLLRYNIIQTESTKLSIYGNTAYNKNKILSLVKDDNAGTTRNVVGGPIDQWFLAPYLGVNPANGQALYEDINGNPTETINNTTDARATGKNMFPVWSGGFGFNFEYKGVFVDAHFTYQADVWKYDNAMAWLYDPSSIGSWNQSADMLNAWSPTNLNGDIPSLTATNLQLADYSDRFLKDASFVRLKNLSVGYSLPKSVLQNTFVKGLKVFVQAENILTWTKWRGYDPEPNFAYSLSVYPNMKTVSLGANIEF